MDREYTVLVPVANPGSVDQLMNTAVDLAKANDGEIVVMSVVTVPQQTPLDEGRRFVGEEREVLDRALEIGDDADVPISGTIRIGHDVAQAILNTIDHEDVDAVLMGWRGRTRRQDFVFGSNVDEVITKARCDVLVERIGEPTDRVADILVPVAGGPHAEFAAEVARAIAATNDSRVHIVTVVEPGATEAEREAARERIASVARLFDEDEAVEQSVLEGSDVVDTIVELTGDYDLTLVGATREGLFQQLLFGAIPERVGQRAENTVIMAKRNLGIRSRLNRWFKRPNR